jgi:hypothetical protein
LALVVADNTAFSETLVDNETDDSVSLEKIVEDPGTRAVLIVVIMSIIFLLFCIYLAYKYFCNTPDRAACVCCASGSKEPSLFQQAKNKRGGGA